MTAIQFTVTKSVTGLNFATTHAISKSVVYMCQANVHGIRRRQR